MKIFKGQLVINRTLSGLQSLYRYSGNPVMSLPHNGTGYVELHPPDYPKESMHLTTFFIVFRKSDRMKILRNFGIFLLDKELLYWSDDIFRIDTVIEKRKKLTQWRNSKT